MPLTIIERAQLHMAVLENNDDLAADDAAHRQLAVIDYVRMIPRWSPAERAHAILLLRRLSRYVATHAVAT